MITFADFLWHKFIDLFEHTCITHSIQSPFCKFHFYLNENCFNLINNKKAKYAEITYAAAMHRAAHSSGPSFIVAHLPRLFGP